MREPVVSDSTCLIGLERIGGLKILTALFDLIIIPPEVERDAAASTKESNTMLFIIPQS